MRELVRDSLRTTRAIATNQIAGAFPRLYMRLAGQTGRGGGDSTPAETAEYFWRCVNDLADRLTVPIARLPAYLDGKHVLEYGPGDIPGVAVLLVALGAARVTCADRFPLLRQSGFGDAVLRELGRHLDAAQRRKLDACLAERDANGLPGGVRSIVHPKGLSSLVGECDLVISRAVLEEANDLAATFDDMAQALAPGGKAIHQVDLRSYGLHTRHPLDFLIPSERRWRLMYGNKCVPNRLRLGTYLALAQRSGLRVLFVDRGAALEEFEVETIRRTLSPEFRDLPASELACLTFWLALEKPVTA